MNTMTKCAAVGLSGLVMFGAAAPAFAADAKPRPNMSASGVTASVHVKPGDSRGDGTVHIVNNSGQSLALDTISEYQMDVSMPKVIPAGKSADISFIATLSEHIGQSGETYSINQDDQALVTVASEGGWAYTFHLRPATNGDGNMQVDMGGLQTGSSEADFDSLFGFTSAATFTLNPNGA